MTLNRSGSVAIAVRAVKHRWDYLRWQAGLWERPEVPHLVKRRTILEYGARYSLRCLVETGTFTGDMLAAMMPFFDRLVSIELSDQLYRWAQTRFRHQRKVQLHRGDSTKILPLILSELREPALFWLDAHYSGGMTARGTLESPIIDELDAVLNHPLNGHVVLVDDARLFVGRHGYPTLDAVRRVVAARKPMLSVETALDILRIAEPR
jgi:hypothetical protein